MNKEFKPTYLYIKTHNVTGLKYFGKTTKSNPYKYQGSGTYWKLHIKKYGYDVTTEIVGLFDDEMWCIFYACEFSYINNIVNCNLWANLLDENGVDGNSNAWSQLMNHNPDILFSSHDQLKEECFSLHLSGMSPSDIAHKLKLNYIDRIRDYIREFDKNAVFNSSWTKIKKNNPNLIFSSYDEFVGYCKSAIESGRNIFSISKELGIGFSAIKKATQL